MLEVMVVLAIMALVIGIAAPRFIDSFGRSKAQAALVQMANLRAAVQLFYIDTGRLPTAAEGLSVLMIAPRSSDGWRGPYLDRGDGLVDPWGRRYLIEIPGQESNFDIVSYGRDGRPGGNGEDSDLAK